MYFLKPGSFTYGFRFHQRYPNTPYWQKLGLAGKQHLGDDLICHTWTPGYAELSGRGAYLSGPQGGNQFLFYPDDTTLLYTFMHMAKVVKTGRINVGDIPFYTGNSGAATTTPHEHVDIWDLKNGPRNPNRPDLFLNPSDPKYWTSTINNKYMPIFYKCNGTFYGEMGGLLVGLAISEVQFNEKYPGAKIITITEAFLALMNSDGVFTLPKATAVPKLLTKKGK